MYYFTFGSAGQLFAGGWVRINAATLREAQDKFIARYGKRAWKPGSNCVLNYAFDYPEERFAKTTMAEEGNMGRFEHEHIP